jgi:DnaK suppressor protein
MPTKATPKTGSKAASKSTAKGSSKSGSTGASKAAAKPKAKAAAKSTAKAETKKTATASARRTAKSPAKTSVKASAKSDAAGKSAARRSAKTGTVSEFRNFEPYKAKRGEEYMSDAMQGHFRNILLRWKAELMEEVDRTVTHMKDEAANFPDPADRATQEEEFSLELRTRDRERKLIKKIDSTMERIDQNDYGYCDACGVEIGVKRLEARPTATLCIDCKTLDEIKERQELG